MFALYPVLFLAGHALAATQSYTFNIANNDIAPDGFTRSAITVNGQFHGTTIIGNKGDQLNVRRTLLPVSQTPQLALYLGQRRKQSVRSVDEAQHQYPLAWSLTEEDQPLRWTGLRLSMPYSTPHVVPV